MNPLWVCLALHHYRDVADTIVRDSIAVIMMGQCSKVCRESPKGVRACIVYLVNGKIIAVKEFGAGTCIGCSMHPASSAIRGETCTGWFVFVSHSEYSARIWRENIGQCYYERCIRLVT